MVHGQNHDIQGDLSDLICRSRMVAFLRNVSIMGLSCLTLLETKLHRTYSLPINTSIGGFVHKILTSKFRTEQTPSTFFVLGKGKEEVSP